jgi:hypothetical protein
MKALLITIALFGAVTANAKDMLFKKNDDPRITLMITDYGKGSASIKKKVFGQLRKKTLISGEIVIEEKMITIVREEGDVCPSVTVVLSHDIKLGENAVAEVRNMFEDAGTAARQYCGHVREMDGSYTRVY